jgi:hypothetical protein
VNRNPLGRGRLVAAVSAIVILVGCLLPWWTVGGGDTGIPPRSGNAFEGAGIVVFLVALATLALVTLPYAAGDRPLVVDGWMSYAVLTVIGFAALGVRLVQLSGELEVLFPTRAPGIWIALVGLVGLAVATAELRGAPRER